MKSNTSLRSICSFFSRLSMSRMKTTTFLLCLSKEVAWFLKASLSCYGSSLTRSEARMCTTITLTFQERKSSILGSVNLDASMICHYVSCLYESIFLGVWMSMRPISKTDCFSLFMLKPKEAARVSKLPL